MPQATVTVDFDQKEGKAVIRLDLQGNNELEHELLVAMVGAGRKVDLVPDHHNDELFAVIEIHDETMWAKAVHNLENRHRVRDGKPTIEEEEALAAQRKANEDAAVKAADEKAKKDAADADAKQTAADEKIAKAVADEMAKFTQSAGNLGKGTSIAGAGDNVPTPSGTPAFVPNKSKS